MENVRPMDRAHTNADHFLRAPRWASLGVLSFLLATGLALTTVSQKQLTEAQKGSGLSADLNAVSWVFNLRFRATAPAHVWNDPAPISVPVVSAAPAPLVVHLAHQTAGRHQGSVRTGSRAGQKLHTFTIAHSASASDSRVVEVTANNQNQFEPTPPPPSEQERMQRVFAALLGRYRVAVRDDGQLNPGTVITHDLSHDLDPANEVIQDSTVTLAANVAVELPLEAERVDSTRDSLSIYRARLKALEALPLEPVQVTTNEIPVVAEQPAATTQSAPQLPQGSAEVQVHARDEVQTTMSAPVARDRVLSPGLSAAVINLAPEQAVTTQSPDRTTQLETQRAEPETVVDRQPPAEGEARLQNYESSSRQREVSAPPAVEQSAVPVAPTEVSSLFNVASNQIMAIQKSRSNPPASPSNSQLTNQASILAASGTRQKGASTPGVLGGNRAPSTITGGAMSPAAVTQSVPRASTVPPVVASSFATPSIAAQSPRGTGEITDAIRLSAASATSANERVTSVLSSSVMGSSAEETGTEAFNWKNTVRIHSHVISSEGPTRLLGEAPAWIQSKAPKFWNTLSWNSRLLSGDPIPMLSNNSVLIMATLAGTPLQSDAGIVFGKLKTGETVRFSGRSEKAFYFDGPEGSRYFALINAAPGANLVYTDAEAGLAVPVVGGSATYLDLTKTETVRIRGRVLDGGSNRAQAIPGAVVRVVGQSAKTAMTDKYGRFVIDGVASVADYPIYVESLAKNEFTHRYRVLPGQAEGLALFRFDGARVDTWIRQLEGGVSPESGLVIGAAPYVVASNEKQSLHPVVRPLTSGTTLVPETYGLTADDLLSESKPLDESSPRLLGVQIPEGLNVVGLELTNGQRAWSEMIVSSPGVINVVGPH